MQRMVEKAFFALLGVEISGKELDEDVKNLINADMLPALFDLAKKHDLAHLVGDALDKNNLFPENSKEKARFLYERDMVMYRYTQQEYELEQICQTLENGSIPFLPLKGSVIRQYYPEAWMRTSCDIDILIPKERLEEAVALLKETMSYEETDRGLHDVKLSAQTDVSLELHFSLVDNEEAWEDILKAVWDKRVVGRQYHFVMPDELLYFYHIAHMAVHMRAGGCGIKPFFDLYILEEKLKFCRKEIEALLYKGGLLCFEKAARKLTRAWVLNISLDETDLALQEYVLSGGVYGAMKNRVAVGQMKKGGKLSYLFAKAFISYDDMEKQYPSLRKRKILFPLYQAYRWFDRLVRKKSKRYIETIRETKNTTKEQLKEVEKLFEEIGL